MNLSKGFYFTVLPLVVLSVLFQFLQETDILSFSYNRFTFLSNISYQVITPNLLHLNWRHWLLNILNLFALIFIFDKAWNYLTFFILFGVSSMGVILSLYLFSPNVVSYVGMSGVIYSLAVYSSFDNFKSQKLLSSILLFFIFLKLFFNSWITHIFRMDLLLNDMHVITDAHRYGAIIGFSFFFLKNKISP